MTTAPAGRRPYRRMDDRLWFDVWERNIGHVERHNIARAVWRRAEPDDRWVSIIGFELAHRWRDRARNLAVVYAMWCLFWGALAFAGLGGSDPDVATVPLAMTLAGVFAIAGCIAMRVRMRPIVEGRTGFAPPPPLPTEA